jgi:ribosomal protein S18 acetylase RimI-like enzyme
MGKESSWLIGQSAKVPKANRLGEMTVRRATPGDAESVARLLEDFQAEFDEPSPGVESLEERYSELIRSKEMIVLLTGDGPDGFAQLRFRPWVYSAGPNAHSYLEELYVVPDRRGNGLGRALLEAAVEAARTEGATHMELGTSEDDTAARALYESAGFTNREGKPDGPVMLFYEREL